MMKMKNIFYLLILMSAVLSHAAYDDVVYAARDVSLTESYLLPGWVDITDNQLKVDGKLAAVDNPLRKEHVSNFAPAGSSTEIRLDDEFRITYMGKTYSSLSIYNDGRIAFGTYTEDLDLGLNPYVKPVNRALTLNGTFRWNCYKSNITPGEVNYTAIEFGPFNVEFHSYSLQVLFYTDGEVHVQLWQYPDSREYQGYANGKPSWEKASIFNGFFIQSLEEDYPKKMSIFENGKLRDGWVAKGFDGSNSKISAVRLDAGQLVYEMGSFLYPGALMAYDYSREHPVVGGIQSVSVNYDYSVPQFANISSDMKLYHWFFDDIKGAQGEDNTIGAGYQYVFFVNNDPNYVRNCSNGDKTWNAGALGNVNITLLSECYYLAWQKLPGTEGHSYSDLIEVDAVKFRPAPAFKFQQRFGDDLTLKFNSVVYNLRQRPTTRFLPPKKDFRLTVTTSSGGLVQVSDMEGKGPYDLYRGQHVEAVIRASVGTEIAAVWLNNVLVYSNSVDKDGAYTSESDLGANAGYRLFFKEKGYESKERIFFEVDPVEMNLDLRVEFGPCSGRKLDLVTPEMHKSTKYLDPENATDARKNSSAVIIGSFGETVQKQDSLIAVDANGKPVDDNYIVSAYYTDDYGQKNYSTSDFVHTSKNGFEYLDMACYGCIVKANDYYDGSDVFDKPNALGVAYVQYDKLYGNNDGSNGTSYGIADASFDYSNEQAKSWTIPVFSSDAFIPLEHLNAKGIAPYYGTNHGKNLVAGYSLTVTRDVEGKHYGQTIKNTKGQTVATWSFENGKEHIVRYEYDEFDRLKTIVPDENSGLAVTYKYDDMGRVIETSSPNRGTTRTKYDKLGRARFVQNDVQARRKTFSAKIYDDQGRDVASVEVKNESLFSTPDATLNPSDYILYNRTVYGAPSADTLKKYGLTLDASLATAIFSNMRNIREKDVGATFAYDVDGNVTVVKMASYDRIGRKDRQWIVYAMTGMPAVELSYSYNSADELVHSSFAEWDGTTFTNRAERYRSYDANGRLTKIEDENHKNLATYEYTANGNVKSKSYYDKGSLVYKKTIIRDVHGRPTEIKYENGNQLLYSDNLDYVNAFAGRVSEATHTWKNLGSRGDETRTGKYTYDEDNRLSKVEAPLSGEYRYDGPYGQMSFKKEGANTVGMSFYDNSSYLPSGYDVNGGSPSASVVYFKYDEAGNVWYDRHAQVAYKVNAAGLPEIAYVLNAHQESLTLDVVESGKVVDVAETMRMAYDEGGSRIWTGFKGAGIDYETATMPGVGTYEWIHIGAGATGFSLKRMDLVAGGFRDVKNDVAYFPVTDAQGNVRGYASTQGLQSAYDYYAYGGVEEIEHGTNDDNRRWQGKEEDTPIRKLYFGSRYYDPFFGMWMSPDPAGQFANPYTYGGDPMNYVDPNGEWVQIVVGAIVGAVVGTVNGAIQCTAPGGGSCGKSVGVGFVGGAAVGAAAAATGGVAAEAAGAGLGGAIVGGAAGGAVGGLGNYATQSFINGSDMSLGGAWDATWKGAATGAIGGGVGGAVGPGAYGALAGGFAGGASGSALNGGSGWDVLKGGLMGAGVAFAGYSLGYSIRGMDNSSSESSVAYSDDSKSIPTSPKGNVAENDPLVKEMFEDFKKFHAEAEWIVDENGVPIEGESSAVYKRDVTFWRQKPYIERTFGQHYQRGELMAQGKATVPYASDFKYTKSSGYSIHSHPNNAYFGNEDYDAFARMNKITYNNGQKNSHLMKHYLLAPDNKSILLANPGSRTYSTVMY